MNSYFVDRKGSHGDENGNVQQDQRNSFVSGLKALFGSVETAPYEVVETSQGYEERTYYPKKWVKSSLTGGKREEVGADIYRKILNYMSGKNKQNLRIPMTTPIVTLVEKANLEDYRYTVSLVIPEQHQKTPPTPGPDIVIEDKLSYNVFSRRFGGYANDETIEKELKELKAILMKSSHNEKVDFSRYCIVTYDPPFKLLNRRNEVWLLATNHKM